MVLERTQFQQFLHWEIVVILKELILTVSTFGGCGDLQKIDSLTVSILGGCGGLERTHLNSYCFGCRCGGFERVDFQ